MNNKNIFKNISSFLLIISLLGISFFSIIKYSYAYNNNNENNIIKNNWDIYIINKDLVLNWNENILKSNKKIIVNWNVYINWNVNNMISITSKKDIIIASNVTLLKWNYTAKNIFTNYSEKQLVFKWYVSANKIDISWRNVKNWISVIFSL